MTLPDVYDRPRWTHRLAVALRFVDHFTGTLVRTPLDVWTELPGTGIWRARRVASDATHRFFLTNQQIPSGTFAVRVDEPLGRYTTFEPIAVTLPRPRTPGPPPALRSDFLVDVPLWPTVRANAAPGETAVTGRIVQVVGSNRVPVPGFRVRIFALPGPAPATPYTRSDANGEFTFRFPALRRLPGPPVVTSVAHGIEVRDTADVGVTPTPASVSLPLGRITVVEITVP